MHLKSFKRKILSLEYANKINKEVPKDIIREVNVNVYYQTNYHYRTKLSFVNDIFGNTFELIKDK